MAADAGKLNDIRDIGSSQCTDKRQQTIGKGHACKALGRRGRQSSVRYHIISLCTISEINIIKGRSSSASHISEVELGRIRQACQHERGLVGLLAWQEEG